MPAAWPHRATPRPPSPASNSPVSTASASALRSVLKSRWATSSARSGWPRRAQSSSSRLREYDLQGLGQGDREQVESQDEQARHQQARQAHADHVEDSDFSGKGGAKPVGTAASG